MSVQNTVKNPQFQIGAGVGMSIGLLMYLRERFMSTPTMLKRHGDYLLLAEYWRERGNLNRAFKTLEIASQDNPEALLELGHAYSEGLGTTANPEMAYKCYRTASERGASPYHLAQALFEGKGCSKFPEKAFEYFIKAAAEGDSKACRVLAKLYLEATPLGTSRHKSLFYTRLAAHRGCSESKKEFEKHCLDAGMLFIDTELDKIAGQMGQGELDEIVAVVAKVEEARLLEEQMLLERQRREEALIAEKARLEAERLAEEQRLEAERIAEEQRLVRERALEAERQAEETKQLEAKMKHEEELRRVELEKRRKEEEAVFAKRLAEERLVEIKKRQRELEEEQERMNLETEPQELKELQEESPRLHAEKQDAEDLSAQQVEGKLEEDEAHLEKIREATIGEEESST